MPRRLSAVFAAALILAACSGGGRRQTSGITSVLVMKHGRIVRGSYYGGVEPTRPAPDLLHHQERDIGAVGIAIARRELDRARRTSAVAAADHAAAAALR
jgi:hypothetical protein